MADVDSVVLRVDNCEMSDYTGCYREDGQNNGKTRYKNLKGERYGFRTQITKDGGNIGGRTDFRFVSFCVPSLSGGLGTILFGSTDTQTTTLRYVSPRFGVSFFSITS